MIVKIAFVVGLLVTLVAAPAQGQPDPDEQWRQEWLRQGQESYERRRQRYEQQERDQQREWEHRELMERLDQMRLRDSFCQMNRRGSIAGCP